MMPSPIPTPAPTDPSPTMMPTSPTPILGSDSLVTPTLISPILGSDSLMLGGGGQGMDDPTPVAIAGYWSIPQSYMVLIDSKGTSYPVTDAVTLKAGLQAIQMTGAQVSILFIKGHGDDEGIAVDNSGTTLSVIQEKVQLAGEDVTKLMQQITGPNTIVTVTGCDTGDLAKNLSGSLGDGVQVTGQTLPVCIGVPFTFLVIGWHDTYVNGMPYTPPAPPTMVAPPFIGF